MAEVHALAQGGFSQRAIARQLGLHRRTVKAWLAQEPPATVAANRMPNWYAYRLPAVDTLRQHHRQALHQQVQTLAQQGLSYSAIARQAGIHRVTVSAWLKAAPKLTHTPASGGGSADAAAAPPPAPWHSWDEVRQIREAVQKYRFLLLRRPEHLTGEEQAHITTLLECPIGSDLRVICAFLEEWYRLWTDEQQQRRTVEAAQTRYVAWKTNPAYTAIPALRRVQDRISTAQFEKLSQFLRQAHWEATNNGAERAGRAFRQLQAPHFNLRAEATITGALLVTACQRKVAATAGAEPHVNRSTRGRKPQTPAPYRAVA